MKDPILEEVWKAKELASAESKSDMRVLVRQIKERVAKLRTAELKRRKKRPA
jgi:hypothetical protein